MLRSTGKQSGESVSPEEVKEDYGEKDLQKGRS